MTDVGPNFDFSSGVGKILLADHLHIVVKPRCFFFFKLGLKAILRFDLPSVRLYCAENTGLYDVPEVTEYTELYIVVKCFIHLKLLVV